MISFRFDSFMLVSWTFTEVSMCFFLNQISSEKGSVGEDQRETEEDSDDSFDKYIDTTSYDHNFWSEFNDNFKY